MNGLINGSLGPFVAIVNFQINFFIGILRWYTLPETNIAPKKMASQKETSIPTIHFQQLS